MENLENRPDWQKRLVEERKELLARIEKLDAYIDEIACDPAVSNEDYRLMRIQYFAMCAYDGALLARMDKLGLKCD